MVNFDQQCPVDRSTSGKDNLSPIQPEMNEQAPKANIYTGAYPERIHIVTSFLQAETYLTALEDAALDR